MNSVSTGAFRDSSLSPSCSSIAVKIVGPAGSLVAVAPASVFAGLSGVHFKSNSYVPFSPVASVTERCRSTARNRTKVPICEPLLIISPLLRPIIPGADSFIFGPALRHGQDVCSLFSLFAPQYKLKALGEQRLRPFPDRLHISRLLRGVHLFIFGRPVQRVVRGGWVGEDIPAFQGHPRWPTRNLIILNIVRPRKDGLEGEAFNSQTSARQRFDFATSGVWGRRLD